MIGIDEGEGRYLANQMAEGPGDTRLIRVSVGQKLSGPGWSVHARKGFLHPATDPIFNNGDDGKFLVADLDILPGSLTGWVEHPSDLNTFFTDPRLQPNMIRYCVIWDKRDVFAEFIEGIANFEIRVQPD